LADRRQPRTYQSIGDVVVALRGRYPDVTASSLRFLEREGLLSPQRTSGGHRVYSDRDIDRVTAIKEWQRQRLSLSDIGARLAELDRMEPPAAISARYLEQVLAGDFAAAYATVTAADDLGLPLRVIFVDVLVPALRDVGDRWHSGQLLVSQEKEVSQLTRDIVAELTWRHAQHDPELPPIVAACVRGEQHELGLQMMCGLLRADGWIVHYLGADVETEFLLESIDLHRAAAALLSISSEHFLPVLRDTIFRLHHERTGSREFPVIVGGRLVHERRDEVLRLGGIPVDDIDPGLVPQAFAELVPSKRIVDDNHRPA
jgi:DNA-binding transcriptional MerR regulator